MKKTIKKAAAPATKRTTVAKATKAPAKKMMAPAKKRAAVTTQPPATFISARIDIGFGNHLYIRGEGPGLSWDHGIAMDCVGNDLWTSAISNATLPVIFKVLVNDLTWNEGEDYSVPPGKSVLVTPAF